MINKIKRLMEFNNINQKQLADGIGLTPVAISRFLSNKRKPTIDFALRISKFFNVSLDWLLNEKNQ